VPYKIIKQKDKFCVAKEDGTIVHCHDSLEKAKNHMAALYANVEDAARKAAGLKNKKE
jgi:hypothetical protein